MSRSRRHNPIASCTKGGIKSGLEAFYKRKARKKLRHRQKLELRKYNELMTVDSRELDDQWSWPKDGKVWFSGEHAVRIIRSK